MSRKHHEFEGNGLLEGMGFKGRKPTLPSLIILILILLQFTKGDIDNHSGFQGIDNGILFIIALFYLSCCNPCKTCKES